MKYFEKFFVCPNCKAPLYRKKALKQNGKPGVNYCGKCGMKIASALNEALAKKKDQIKEAAEVKKMDMDALFKAEDKPKIDEITELVKSMNEKEQSGLLIFLQAAKFVETLKAAE